MNLLEQLSEQLRKQVTGIITALDPPDPGANGSWWLDVSLGERQVIVEWRPALGFGVSTPSDGFGEGPDEFYADVPSALSRIVGLLQNGGHTIPFQPEALRRLREARGITQSQLAELMGVRQAAISKIERRGDVSLDTLRRFVQALGGVLEVKVKFGDQVLPIVLDLEPNP
jgi:DNA-binding XRE family transcriptional regulator